MSVCPIVRNVVRERHIADAKAIEVSKRIKRILYGIAALDTHQHTDFALPFRIADVGRTRAHRECFRMTLDLAICCVDQIHCTPHRTACLERRP